MTGTIYMAVNTVNGKAYVGQTVKPLAHRKQAHLSDARRGCDVHFHRALRKHGAGVCFAWRVLASGVPLSQLSTQERFWIRFYDTYRSGYNATTGGDVTPMAYSEIRAKVSATQRKKAARGEHSSQRSEVREKLSAIKKAQSAIGENPMQNPEVVQRGWATRRKNVRHAQIEAGQQVLFEGVGDEET